MSRSRRRPAGRDPGDEPEQVLHHPAGGEPGETVLIEGSEAGHARRSLRLKPGNPVALVDGRGRRFHGSVTDLGKRSLSVAVERVEELPRWPAREIWLGAGVLRSTRMDTLIEKASELGVTRFFPLMLKRCVARPHEEGTKIDRWHRLAVESLKQSKRATLLGIEDPLDLDGFLERLPGGISPWVAEPSGAAPDTLAAAREEPDPVVLVVGPEGGLAEEEVGILSRAGGRFVRLGGNRLRAETASITLAVLALARLGEMDPAEG